MARASWRRGKGSGAGSPAGEAADGATPAGPDSAGSGAAGGNTGKDEGGTGSDGQGSGGEGSSGPVRAALDALPESAPVAGEASAPERNGHLSELVAYATLDNALSRLTADVQKIDPVPRGVLVVEDRALLHSAWPHRMVTAQLAHHDSLVDTLLTMVTETLERIEDDRRAECRALAQDGGGAPVLMNVVPEGIPLDPALSSVLTAASSAATALSPVLAAGITAVGALPKVAGAVADVLAMFRTSYAFAGRTMTPQGTPLVAEASHALRARRIPVWVDGFDLLTDSPLLDQVGHLHEQRAELARRAVPLRAERARTAAVVAGAEAVAEETRAAALAAAKDGPNAELDARARAADLELARAQAAAALPEAAIGVVDQGLDRIDAFLTALVTAGDDGAAPPLLTAATRERLLAEGSPVSHVLFVSLDTIGAESAAGIARFAKEETSLLVGGLQVSYLVLDVATGRTVAGRSARHLNTARYTPRTGELTFIRSGAVGSSTVHD